MKRLLNKYLKKETVFLPTRIFASQYEIFAEKIFSGKPVRRPELPVLLHLKQNP
jgi:hypothetical protein